MIAMMVMMEKFLLKMFIFGRLVLDYNEACTNEEDCQDWIVKIKVRNFVLFSKCFNSESKSENQGKECCFPLKVFLE